MMNVANVIGKSVVGLVLAGLLAMATAGMASAQGCYFGEGDCGNSDEYSAPETTYPPQGGNRVPPPVNGPAWPQQQMAVASMCATPMTACPMAPGVMLPRGSFCQCFTQMGVFPGQAF